MTIEIRYAWLQKHPSPAATRGEFHWYPAEGDRELRASFVERSRGIDAPAVLWQLAPGRVSWARVFAATAPIDGRRYVGLVLATAEGAGATPAELLEALEVPPAVPWQEGSTSSELGDGRDAGGRVASVEAARAGAGNACEASAEAARAGAGNACEASVEAARAGAGNACEASVEAARAGTGRADGRGSRVDTASAGASKAGVHGERAAVARFGRRVDAVTTAEVAAIARALLGGGDAVIADPERADLPGLVASVERWMPARVAGRSRRGAWRSGAVSQASDRVAALIAAAWREPRSRAAQAWHLLCELAEARGSGVDEIVAELAASEQPAAALTDAERATLGEIRDFVATLHAWGRGRLDGGASAATLTERLAEGVAMRMLACLLADREPSGPIAEARWHALLPAARRAGLLDALVRRAACLRAFVEVPHA